MERSYTNGNNFEITGTTSTVTIKCAYCGHDLSNANPIVYINGEPICLLCRSQLNGGIKNEYWHKQPISSDDIG